MKQCGILITLSFILLVDHVAGQDEAVVQQKHEVLMRARVAEGVEIVVVQSPRLDAARLQGLLPKHVISERAPLTHLIGVRAEIHVEQEPVLLLWAETFGVSEGVIDPIITVHAIETTIGESDVVLFGAFRRVSLGEIVVAIGYGNWIVLHHQVIPSAPTHQPAGRIKVFRASDWDRRALPLPGSAPPGDLQVKLEYNDQGLWTVQFLHRLDNREQHTLFRQIDGRWDFELVRRNGG